jgi:hypothetical protein
VGQNCALGSRRGRKKRELNRWLRVLETLFRTKKFPLQNEHEAGYPKMSPYIVARK